MSLIYQPPSLNEEQFLDAKQRLQGKFSPSRFSSCGKTLTNFIFKTWTAITESSLVNYSTFRQFKQNSLYFRSDTAFKVDHKEAGDLTLLPNTFYILDGRDADPGSQQCSSRPLAAIFSRTGTIKCRSHRHISPLPQCRSLCYPAVDEATVDA